MHLPLAFSIHHFISSVGADAGFAAIIGLAILVLLYFAQARETTTLRDEAISASQRVEQLERRVAQLGGPPVAPAPETATSSPQAGASGPAAPGAPAGGARVAPARPVANPVPTATPGAERAPLPPSGSASTSSPAAPAGVGAPALADATRLIPTAQPAPEAGQWSAHAGQPWQPAAAAAREATPPRENEATRQAPLTGQGKAPPEAEPPREETVRRRDAPAALATPPPATAAAGAGQTQSASESPPAPVAGIDGGGPSRSRPAASGPPRQLPPEMHIRDGSRSPGPMSRGQRGPTKRWLSALLGVLLLAGVIAVLLVVTSGGGTSHSAARGTRNTNAPAARAGFNPASVTVAVLNGTDVSQLAHRVEQKLARSGYKGGTVATAADQTHATSVVAYLPGYQSNAEHVASSLGLPTSAVQPVDQSARAIACPPPSACGASVVVTVGSDLASTK